MQPYSSIRVKRWSDRGATNRPQLIQRRRIPYRKFQLKYTQFHELPLCRNSESEYIYIVPYPGGAVYSFGDGEGSKGRGWLFGIGGWCSLSYCARLNWMQKELQTSVGTAGPSRTRSHESQPPFLLFFFPLSSASFSLVLSLLFSDRLCFLLVGPVLSLLVRSPLRARPNLPSAVSRTNNAGFGLSLARVRERKRESVFAR